MKDRNVLSGEYLDGRGVDRFDKCLLDCDRVKKNSVIEIFVRRSL